MDRVMSCFADDVVFDLSHYEAWRGAPRYDGPTSMISFLAEWMSWWHGYHQEMLADELHGRDVLLSVRHRGDRDGAHVEEIGGLVVRGSPRRQGGALDRVPVGRAGARMARATGGAHRSAVTSRPRRAAARARRAANPTVTSRRSVLRAELRAEALVDRAQLVGVRRREARPPDAARSRRSVSGSGGDRRAAAPKGRGSGPSRPACRARPCRSGPAGAPASRATATGSRPTVVLPSESSTIADGGGCGLACRWRTQRVERDLQRVAGRGAAVGDWRVDDARARRRGRSSATARRRAVASSATTPTRDAVGQLVEEAVRGRLRGAPGASGRTSVATIEPRVVGDEHDRRALDRHGDGALRLGQRRAPARRAPRAPARPAGAGASAARAPAASASVAAPPGSAPRSGARAGAAAASAASASGTRSRASSKHGEREAHRSRRPSARSQSPSVRQRARGRRAGAAARRATRSRALGLERGEALAHARRGGVDLDARAGLGIDERQAARRRAARASRGSRDLDGEHRVARAQRAQRARPVAAGRGSRR